MIYTTNAIKGFNRHPRKVTKAKLVFLTDDSLLKMLYLSMMDITRKSGPDGCLFCRAHVRVTLLGSNIKGKLSGSAGSAPGISYITLFSALVSGWSFSFPLAPASGQ